MKAFHLIGHIFSWAVFIYFAANTIYLFIIAVFGIITKGHKFQIHPDKLLIAIIVPCIKEDQVILNTARQAIMHDYPASPFTVTVVSDKLSAETVNKLK